MKSGVLVTALILQTVVFESFAQGSDQLRTPIPKCSWTNVAWSLQKKKPKGDFVGVYQFSDTLVLWVWRSKNSLIIESTDGDMNLIANKKIEITHYSHEGAFDIDKVFRLGNNLCVLTSVMSKSIKHYFIYLQSINPVTLDLNNQVDFIGNSKIYNRYGEKFDFESSEDFSKCLIGLNDRTNNSNGYELIMLDQELHPIIKEVFKSDLEKSQIKSMDMNTNGDLVFILSHLEHTNGPDQLTKIISIVDGEIKNSEFNLSCKHNSGIELKFNSDQRVTVSGFYSDTVDYKTTGVYNTEYDPLQGLINEVNYYPFNYKDVTKYYSDETKLEVEENPEKRKLYQFDRFNTMELIEAENNYYLIGEQNRSSTNYSKNLGYDITTQSLGEVIAVKLSKTGEIIWVSRIRKYNYNVRNDNDGAFKMNYSESGLYFVYTDNLLNYLSEDNRKVHTVPYGGYYRGTAVAKIDSKGIMTKAFLFNVSNENLLSKIKFSSPIINSNGFNIMAEKKGKYKTVKITFSEN